MTGFMLDLDFHRVARIQVRQCRNKGIHLIGGVDGIDDMPRIGAQHAALIGDADRGGAITDRVDAS